MNKEERKLTLTFDPNTIEHLGVKMYSSIPTAVAELIANAYDAGAKKVSIILEGGNNKKITVEDDGIGMTFEEVEEKFLKIGRNRRSKGEKTSPDGNRKVTGKKGLGKLALFGIGELVEVSTIKDGRITKFRLDWDRLKKYEGNYPPEIIEDQECSGNSGTTITVSRLKRKTDICPDDLAVSLSKLFNLFDNNFEVFVITEKGSLKVDKELRYANIDEQFAFDFPDYSKKIKTEYGHKSEINGKLITTEKPLTRPGLRGITIFANGRLVNAPEFFERSESSHFYSYLTGWLDADFLDDYDEDLISTNRQSLNWNHEVTAELKKYLWTVLSEVQKDWRAKRKTKRNEDITQKTEINVAEWYDKLPPSVLAEVKPILDAIVDDSELPQEKQIAILKGLHNALPEYTYFHFRNLHPEIRKASQESYEKANYYPAVLEAAKKYINATKTRASEPAFGDRNIMERVFGKDRLFTVTKKYKRMNGECFAPNTIENIEEGQRGFSIGIVTGVRHPIVHEETAELRDSGLFTEKDCLDMLSLLSHLFRRLEDSELRI